MNEHIKELLISEDSRNNILGVQLAFSQYGKSVETFIDIIKNSVNPIKIITDMYDLTRLQVTNEININFWITKWSHNQSYDLDCSLNDAFDSGNESIFNNQFNVSEIDLFIKLHDISTSINIFTIRQNINTLDVDNYRVDTFLRRLYHFLTYFDIL